MNRKSFTGPSRSLTDTVREQQSSLFRSRSNNSNIITHLEELINIDQNIEEYSQNQLNTISATKLYKKGIFEFKTSLIRGISEQTLSVTTQPLNIELLNKETIQKLQQSKYGLFHIGLICIGIKGLARRGLGTKILVGIIDKNWTKNVNKALIAATEVDMNNNTGLFYISPQITKSIKDLQQIQIILQSKGYEDYQGDNIILSKIILEKATNSSRQQYKLNIEGVVDMMTSKGIKIVKPKNIPPTELTGFEWNLTKHMNEDSSVITPRDCVLYKDLNGQRSLRFLDYQKETPAQEET